MSTPEHTPLAVTPEERQARILQRLSDAGRVVAADLAVEFGTSEHTIRRDLTELATRKLCQRVHGGALRYAGAVGTLRERSDSQSERKALLAQTAASLIGQAKVIFLDAGSTNLAIAKALPADGNLTVVTNAPAIAEALAEHKGHQLIVIGGHYSQHVGGSVGALAVSQLALIRPDLCFLGACAIDPELGLSCVDFEDAAFKRALVAASASVVVAVTNEKFGTASPYTVCAVDALDRLVVESSAPEASLQTLTARGVRIEKSAA